MDQQEREKRLQAAKVVARAIAKRDQIRKMRQEQKQTKEEADMPIFWISDDESKQLDNMTVRALAENPEAARAFFDQYGVFLTDEKQQLIGIADYNVVSNPTSTTSLTEDTLYDGWGSGC